MYRYIILLPIIVFVMTACSKEEKQIEPTNEKKIVKTLSLKEQNSPQNWYEFPAEIYPFHSVNMAFEVSGKIVQTHYDMGDEIKKDATIAQLDDTIYKANYEAALANYEKAHKDFLRYKELYNKKAISKSDFESAKQLKSVSQAKLNIAKKNFENTKLKAEFDGVLAKKYVDDFARIRAKEPILTLQDNTKLKVKFFIPESDMLKVSKDLDIDSISKRIGLQVSVGDLKETLYKAKLMDIATKAEDITRTFEITLLMDNPETRNILPGMSAKVHVSLKNSPSKKEIFLPLQAVFTDASKQSKVWIVKENNTVSKKSITLGRLQQDKIEISQGLKGDEKVVISGIKELQEGDKIQKYKKLDN